ncbi:MAG: hypothetical protein M5U23_02580 [Acidimicrobiia bacterium]|nr:hypothetical protein [Acidimicrobiia bacterium]
MNEAERSKPTSELSWWQRNVTNINAPPRHRFRQFRYWLYPKLIRFGTTVRVIPRKLTYDDELTTSGRRYVWRLLTGVAAFTLGLMGISLLADTSWREVIAGALIAWSISLIVWARSSYRQGKAHLGAELTRVTEVDLLHARLNRIDHALGIGPIDIDEELQPIIDARLGRLAHYGRVEELRESPHDPSGYAFWDGVAIGSPEPTDEEG